MHETTHAVSRELMASKFRLKSSVVEAIQWDGSDEAYATVESWYAGSALTVKRYERVLSLECWQGTAWVLPGEWLIRGEVAARKDVEFHFLYEPVAAHAPARQGASQ